jgi:hypothetical protein
MCADRALGGGLRDGSGAGIAEAEEDFPGALGLIGLQEGDGVLEGLDTEVTILARALNAIKEGGEVNELAP